MPIPSVMSDLSTTAASNYPTGSESPTTGDDYIRAYAAILRATNAKGADIASATTTDIGAATGEFVDVTGTTTITGLGTIASGIKRVVRFTGALTLTYNATSLILPGNANITTANGDIAMFRSLGSGNWLCTAYLKRDGTSTVSPAPFSDATAIIKGSGDATKLLAFEVDTNQPTATTRTITTQSTSGTMELVESQIKPISSAVAANALTLTINPLSLAFRSSTLTSGTVSIRNLTSAATVVVPSSATLGTQNGIKERLIVLAIDNAGTIEAAVVNARSGLSLDGAGVISTTAISAAATSATTIYSTTARTNVAYRVVGFVDITEATAGTWATDASLVQGTSGEFSAKSNSMVQLNTANGYGSTNTVIRRFTNTVTNIGTDITYADSATNGGSFTINTPGVYAISYTDQYTGQGLVGISLNSNQLTTSIASITQTNILAFVFTAQANLPSCVQWTGRLNAGDVIRAHDNAVATGTNTTGCQFTITRIA